MLNIYSYATSTIINKYVDSTFDSIFDFYNSELYIWDCRSNVYFPRSSEKVSLL